MQAVIMAGGKGTRLSGLTRDEIPKPMVPILGKPLLLWQMDALKQHGITNILLVIGHLGHVIQNYFGNGRTFGLHIQYYHEEVPLGTAGALARIRPMLEETFFLIYGDVLFDIDLSRMERFHSQKQSAATLFVHPNSHPFDSDLVEMDAEQRVLRFDSKQNLRSGWYDNCVNAGLYLMDRGICDELPDQERIDLEADVLMPLCRRKGAIYAYPSPEYIKDIGTMERIRAAEADIKSGIAAARNLKRPQRAVFLDRDGTVNVKRGLISGTEQFELEKNAAEAIRKINQSGYLAIVVTNQPAVARGLCGVEEIEEIHRKMQTLLGREGVFLDAVRYCPHHPDKGYPEENPAYKIPCRCRKPDIGMLEDCAEKYNISLADSWLIGDTTVDIQTGKNAGTKTALVLTGDAGRDKKYNAEPDLICADILDAAERILGKGL